MKEILKKISVTILSLVVLLSSMSFTIEKHYCGERLIDVSYFGDAKGCCENNETISTKVNEDSCCKDVLQIIESSTFDKEKLTKFSQKNIEFLVYFIVSYIHLFQQTLVEKEFYKNFSPPNIDKDISILYQTFLI